MEELADRDSYRKVARTGEIGLGKILCVELAGREILICHTSEGFFAIRNLCSHAHSPLAAGRLRGHRILCPLHGAAFDVRDGSVLSRPAIHPIESYPTRVEGEEILVAIDERTDLEGDKMPQKTQYVDFADGVAARPRASAELDTEPYTSPDYMQSEWERIWTKTWLFAGLESDLEEAGDYFVYEIGQESIVVMRDERAELVAYYNVCQHRGNRIFSNPRGSVSEVSCPYHGWTYGLDGALKRVPDIERFDGRVVADERSLKPVRLEVWAGLVWICMNPLAKSLAEFLGVIIDQLSPFHFERMLLVKEQTVSLGANWKTTKDNFLEQYHVDFIHPQHASLVDCCNSENDLWPYGHSRTLVEGFVTNPRYPIPEDPPIVMKLGMMGLGMDPEAFNGRIQEVRGAVPEQKREVGRALGMDYSDLGDAELTDIWQYDLFPNLFMTVRAEEVWIFGPRPHPTDPNRCFLDKWTLQIPKEIAFDQEKGYSLGVDPSMARVTGSDRPDREVFTREDVIAGRNSMTITVDQDIFYLNDMQAGLHSRGFDRAVLNDDEIRVQHFHDWAKIWMEGDPLSGGSAE